MMDPVSIVSILGVACSAAKGAVVVGTAIYKFQRDVKDYDEKAEGFANEIKALGGACDAVGQRLRLVLKNGEKVSLSSDQSEKLWICLKIQLEACQKTVDGLQEALNDAILCKGDTVWNRILKQLLLYLHVFDIEEARERIRSHTASLQIILLSIGIEMTYLLPGRIDQHLHQEFQKQLNLLIEMKEELSDLLRKRAKDGSSLDEDSKNEDAIISATRYVITCGETLYEQSIAGESMYDGRRRDVPPLTGNRLVKQWLELQEDHITPIKPSQNVDTPSNESKRGPVDSVADGMEHHKTHLDKTDGRGRVSEVFDEELDDDQSDDSDDDVEFAKHSFDEGRKEFEKQNYDQANAFLQEALKMYLELPFSRRPTCDIDEINYMLAHCAFYLKDVASAHSALLAVLANETTNTADRSAQTRTYETSHMLSQACVKLGKLEQARVSCKSALKGRKQLFGKSHEAVYESIALMARITELQGNVTKAKLYERYIPESHRHLMAQFAGLNIDQLDSQLLPTEQARQSPRLPQHSDETGIEPSGGIHLDKVTVGEQSIASDGDKTLPDDSLPTGRDTDPADPPPPVRPPVTLPERTYRFEDPNLQAWADSRGYKEIGPLSLSQRKRLLTEFELMPESQIEKALAAAHDEEALKLCSARARIRSMVSRFKFSLAREMRLAVLFGVDSVVKVLLDRGVSLDAADTGGWTLLHYAAYSGSIATAEVLVRAGASVEVSERKGQMAPLSIALKHDRLDICDLLYHNGAHPWLEHHWKIGTPFHLACAKDILPLVQLWSQGRLDRITSAIHTVTPGLLDRRFFRFVADFGNESQILPRVVKRMKISPIGVAALMGSVDVMQWAVSKGVRVHEPCRLSETEYGDGQSTSALALAAAAGQTEMVRLLLREQGDSIQEADPVVALKMAVINRMEDAACALLEAGVRLDRQIVFWAERYDLTSFLSVATFDEGSQVTRNSRFSHIMVEQTI